MARRTLLSREFILQVISGLLSACVIALFSFIVTVNSDLAVAKDNIKTNQMAFKAVMLELKQMRKEAKKDRKEIINAVHKNKVQLSNIEARVINLEKR